MNELSILEINENDTLWSCWKAFLDLFFDTMGKISVASVLIDASENFEYKEK